MRRDEPQDELVVTMIRRASLAGASSALARECVGRGRRFFNERADHWSAEATALADEVAGRAVAARPRGL
jgi:hypothetical protein